MSDIYKSKNNIKPLSRSRKTMHEQLASMGFASRRLIEGKGKHARQFRKMDEQLQNRFKTLDALVDIIKSEYDVFLFKIAQEDEKLAQKAMPKHLRDKIPLEKESRNGNYKI